MFRKLLAGSIAALYITRTLAAGVEYAGVNIAGFDFGCSTDGTCVTSSAEGPIPPNGPDGPGQMQHFATKDKLNIFRLPVGWQYLVNNKLGGTLDETNFGNYDKLVQACLGTGAHCIIDIHNYARWNGAIIGESGGPTTDDFAGLWKQLATKYATESSVVMGLMNEPHDLTSLDDWAKQVQAAVTAIRGAGATTQMILLPGNGYTGAATFVSGGSADALAKVTNTDGSTDGLIFDVHSYFDSDSSGTHANCVTDHINDSFQPLATWLKGANRQAILSETGGGSNDQTCLTNVCAALDFLNENNAEFLGYIGWAAGSFAQDYVLSLVPNGDTDVPLMQKCFAAKFGGGVPNETPALSAAASTVAGTQSSLAVPQTISASPSAIISQGTGSVIASPTSGAPFLNNTAAITETPIEVATSVSNPEKSKPCPVTYTATQPPLSQAEETGGAGNFPGPVETGLPATPSEAGETIASAPSATDVGSGPVATGFKGHGLPDQAPLAYWHWLEEYARMKQHKPAKCESDGHGHRLGNNRGPKSNANASNEGSSSGFRTGFLTAKATGTGSFFSVSTAPSYNPPSATLDALRRRMRRIAKD